ncbi:MAG TPA: response regulator [Candidatus Acidoferrum sp.]|nr:response regulator [Candidatus Acidoferrum sp.]
MTNKHELENEIRFEDVAALTKDTNEQPGIAKPELTQSERNDQVLPQPLVKIVNYKTGDVTQASLAQLNQQMRDFRKVILLIEDQPAFSDTCTKALHELGYDGVQLITHVMEAENHLDDIVSNLTEAPAAIVLDLGLGMDSGFTLLRKCHAEPRLQQVPILVWTKHTDDLSKTFSNYLGAKDFLVKSGDPQELRDALKRLMVPTAAQTSKTA